MADNLPPFLKLTLDEEIQHLIAIHGRDAAKDAIRRLAGARRGRPQIEADAELYAHLIKRDAIDWLEGRGDLNRRTNNAIAREYAEKQPGHSAASTKRRILRKLSKNRQRAAIVAAYMLTNFEQSELARAGFRVTRWPFAAHFRALEALSAEGESYWRDVLKSDRRILDEYREFQGEPPPDMSWREIVDSPKQLRSVDAQSLLDTETLRRRRSRERQQPTE